MSVVRLEGWHYFENNSIKNWIGQPPTQSVIPLADHEWLDFYFPLFQQHHPKREYL